MESSLFRGLTGCLGTLVCLSSFNLGISPSQALPTLVAQTSTATPSATTSCSDQLSLAEATAREWVLRSQQASQSGRMAQASQMLIRAVGLTQQLPTTATKASVINFITEMESYSSPLAQLVTGAASSQPQLALDALSATLPVVRSLPTAYSYIKTQALVAIARHYTTLNQPTLAASVLAEAEQASQFLQGDEFKAKAWTAIAQSYQPLGQDSQAIALLNAALPLAQSVPVPLPLRRAMLLEPIAITYAQTGAFEQALQVIETIPTDFSPTYRDQPIAEIALAFGEREQFDSALQQIERIQLVDIKADTVAKLAVIAAQQNHHQQSNQLFDRAIAIAFAAPDPAQQSRVAGQVLQTYSEVASFDKRLAIAQTIPIPSTRAQTLLDLAAETDRDTAADLVAQALTIAQQVEPGYERWGLLQQAIENRLMANQFAIALQIAQSLDENEPFSDKYTVIGRIGLAAAEAGEPEVALQAMQLLPDSWTDHRNQVYRAMAIYAAQQGQYDQAIALTQSIDNYGGLPYQVRTLTAIAQQLASDGKTERAEQLLTQAISITEALNANFQQTDGLAAIAIVYTKMGQAAPANQLTAQAIQIAQVGVDTNNNAYMLRQMMLQYLDAGLFSSAAQVAQAMQDEGERSRALSEIITQLIEQEKFDDALQTATMLPRPEDQTRFLIDVARQYTVRGEFEPATALLDQAFETAMTIADPESRMIQLRSDLSVDDFSDRGSLLEMIALAHAEMGQINQAQQVAQAIESVRDRAQLLQRIACL